LVANISPGNKKEINQQSHTGMNKTIKSIGLENSHTLDIFDALTVKFNSI
jgi:hypothetical protein